MSAHGLLVVNKPRGPTSHDVVAGARRSLGTRAVGHAGTLDPMASGVLVLLVGEGTKLTPYLTLDDKEYIATVTFGRATDTLDAEGDTVEEQALPAGGVDATLLDAALDLERRRTEQVPPAFSAISVGGMRAHRLSRRGQAPELPPRVVSVRAIELLARGTESVKLRVSVSKGYYVRSLAHDLGVHVGLPAHLSGLERTVSGPYRLEHAVAWPLTTAAALVSVEQAASQALPSARLTPEGVIRASCGKTLTEAHFHVLASATAAWFDETGTLIAIGAPSEEGAFRVVRGFQAHP